MFKIMTNSYGVQFTRVPVVFLALRKRSFFLPKRRQLRKKTRKRRHLQTKRRSVNKWTLMLKWLLHFSTKVILQGPNQRKKLKLNNSRLHLKNL